MLHLPCVVKKDSEIAVLSHRTPEIQWGILQPLVGLWDLFGFSSIYLSSLMSANTGVSPGVILVLLFVIIFCLAEISCCVPGVWERGRNFQIALRNADGVEREIRGCLSEVTFVHGCVFFSSPSHPLRFSIPATICSNLESKMCSWKDTIYCVPPDLLISINQINLRPCSSPCCKDG